MCVREDFGADQLLYDGGDATLLVHKGKELEVKNATRCAEPPAASSAPRTTQLQQLQWLALRPCLHGKERPFQFIGWCTVQMMCVPEACGADQLMNDGGDATLLVHKGKELEVKNAKDGICQEQGSWLDPPVPIALAERMDTDPWMTPSGHLCYAMHDPKEDCEAGAVLG